MVFVGKLVASGLRSGALEREDHLLEPPAPPGLPPAPPQPPDPPEPPEAPWAALASTAYRV